MGSFLSQPVTDIEFGEEKAKDLSAVFASMQGWRSSQEDAHLIKLNFDNEGSHIFGIFDGHGSDLISNYVATNFVSVLTSMEAYKEKKYDLALEQTFLRFDELLEQDSVVAELERQQEKSNDGTDFGSGSFMEVFKSRFQKLIKEQEDDEPAEDEENTSNSEKKTPSNDADESKDDEASKIKSTSEEKIVEPEGKDQNNSDPKEAHNVPKDSKKKVEDSSKSTSDEASSDLEQDTTDEDEDFSAEDQLGDEEDEMESTDMRAMMADSVYQQKFSKDLKPAKDRELPGYGCGTTANVVLISGGKYYVANAGDSRSIICTKDEVIALSNDHGPENPDEKDRIEKAGGMIIEGRVNAGLNLSRAIGDLYYKRRTDLALDQQLIISKPEVRVFDSKPTDRFLVLACDGIWNSLSNEATSKYFEQDNLDVKKQFKTLFHDILADGASPDGFGMDNMSAIYVHLNESNTDEDVAKSSEKSQGKKRKLELDSDNDCAEQRAKIAHE